MDELEVIEVGAGALEEIDEVPHVVDGGLEDLELRDAFGAGAEGG